MKQSADVVIIGGGIQGLSLAYHLALRGITDVCLLEMNTLGSGSSGRSATMIGFAFQSEKCLPLTHWSFSALMRFHEELGTSPGYEPIGCLLLAGARTGPSLRRRQAILAHEGVQSHLLDSSASSELTPGLNLDDVQFGLYNPRDGAVDAHMIMMGYSGQARKRGVEFVEGVRAVGLQVRAGRVAAVDTTAGRIATSCVVNAAGFNARRVAAWAGLDLPIANLKRHLFFTGPVPTYERSIPFTYDADWQWYMRREGPGMLIGMGEAESDEEDPQVDWSFLEVIIEHSVHRAPALADAGVKTGWAGLRPVTPDEDRILGPAAEPAGFWNDCGWGGHGIMHSPAAGVALAEWIGAGRPSSVDIRPFGAERFASRDPKRGLTV